MKRHILVPMGLLLECLSAKTALPGGRRHATKLINRGKNELTDLEHQTAGVLLLPETVDYVNLNQVSCVLVEMRQEKVNIM